MLISFRNIAAILIFSSVFPAHAQVENFTLLDARTRKMVSLNHYASKKGIVVVFASNHCPYSKLYIDRIKRLAQTHQQDIQFLLINPNNPQSNPKESVQQMADVASEHDLPFPYLADKEKKLTARLQATKTPEAFVLIPSGGGFNVYYKGAIDDSPSSEASAQENFLNDALLALRSDQTLRNGQSRPIGCTIRD